MTQWKSSQPNYTPCLFEPRDIGTQRYARFVSAGHVRVHRRGTAAADTNAAHAANHAAEASPARTGIDNGVRDPAIHDSRVDTCKRQATRDKYDVASFNFALVDGEGLDSAVADAMADFQAEQAARKH